MKMHMKCKCWQPSCFQMQVWKHFEIFYLLVNVLKHDSLMDFNFKPSFNLTQFVTEINSSCVKNALLCWHTQSWSPLNYTKNIRNLIEFLTRRHLCSCWPNFCTMLSFCKTVSKLKTSVCSLFVLWLLFFLLFFLLYCWKKFGKYSTAPWKFFHSYHHRKCCFHFLTIEIITLFWTDDFNIFDKFPKAP